MVIAADAERRQVDLDLAYYTAWHAGLFSQAFPKGKFPPFEKFRPGKKRKKTVSRQPWQQQKQFAMMLNALMGGDTKRRDQS